MVFRRFRQLRASSSRFVPAPVKRGAQRVGEGYRLLLAVGIVIMLPVAWLWGDRPPEIEGLPEPVRDIAVVHLGLDDYARRLAREAHLSLTDEVRCRRAAFQDLGLVRGTAGAFPMPPAYYVAGTDTLYTFTGETAALSHEWVHAIEDQVAPRMARAKERKTSDGQWAIRAAIEGTAITWSEGDPWSAVMGWDVEGNAAVLAYGSGPAYVREMLEGSEDRAESFHLEPETSYEVLFRVPPRGRVALPTLPESSARVLCTDEIGVLGVIAAMTRAGATEAEIELVARAWVGDLLVRVADGPRTRTTWMVALDDELAERTWARRAIARNAGLPLGTSVGLHTSVGALESAPGLAREVEQDRSTWETRAEP